MHLEASTLSSQLHEVFVLTESGMVYWWISLGAGLPLTAIPQENVAKFSLVFFPWALLNVPAIVLPKLSALFLYRRIFEKTSLWLSISIWSLIAINAAYILAFWFLTIFSCQPVRKILDSTIQGTCLDTWNSWVGSAIPSAIIDIMILVLPMPPLLKLQRRPARKALTVGIFVAGYSYAVFLGIFTHDCLLTFDRVVVISVGRLIVAVTHWDQVQMDPTCKPHSLREPHGWSN